MLAACGGSGHDASSTTPPVVTPPPASPTLTFTASPTSVASGAGATLTWSTTNATSCTASTGWSGAKATSSTESTAALSATTTYTLTCAGVSGTTDATASATVTVTPPPPASPTLTFTALPTSVATGSGAMLNWSATNATSCTASVGWNGTKATSGSVSTGALGATTSYTLSCAGASGTTAATATATVTVTQPPPPPASLTLTFTALPVSVVSGGSAMLNWSTTNATSCTASVGWNGTKAASGSVSTGALGTTTSYTLTCAGASGTTPAMATATVTVTQPPPASPTLNFTVSPASVVSGGSATFSWSTTNAISCTASGSWSGTKATSGTASTGALNAAASYTLTCTGASGTTPANNTVTVSITNTAAFLVTPRIAPLTLSQSQQFTAAVPGGGAVSWSVDAIPGGNTTVGTVSATGLYAPPAMPGLHSILATSVADATKAGTATAAVTDLAGVYTYHNDLARTGGNLQEYALSPATVSSGNFGKRWSCPVDGEIYAQPLYLANLPIGGGVHNVVFLVTQHDTAYAFDADDPSCVTYWKETLVIGTTVVPITYNDLGGCNDITEFGITGTPVIDPTGQTLYFVAATKEHGTFHQRLHALNVQTGDERSGSPVDIQATVPGSGAGGSRVTFGALLENQRPGLAFYNGGVFIAWSGHCDKAPYWGWQMRYDATTLAQTAVYNVAPNGVAGGIWMSAAAPAVDSAGGMFLTTGNGTFDNTASALPPVSPQNDLSMSFINFNPATLAVQDFYTPSKESMWSGSDLDISASGVTVLPDGIGPSGHPNLLVGSDKQGHLWLIDRANMSGFNVGADNVVQYLILPGTTGTTSCKVNCIFSTFAYYNQTVYAVLVKGHVMALPLTAGLFNEITQVAVPSTMSTQSYGYPAATPSISASPLGAGVIWVLDNNNFANQGDTGTTPAGPAILRAYDASNLATILYDSSTLAADTAGNAVKFTLPVVANGHVYLGNSNQLTVYGLAP